MARVARARRPSSARRQFPLALVNIALAGTFITAVVVSCDLALVQSTRGVKLGLIDAGWTAPSLPGHANQTAILILRLNLIRENKKYHAPSVASLPEGQSWICCLSSLRRGSQQIAPLERVSPLSAQIPNWLRGGLDFLPCHPSTVRRGFRCSGCNHSAAHDVPREP
jgi:hypothetical protein